MPNISHKTLTGGQLHENKGVDTATADQVATATGAGATVWKKLTGANLTGTGNPFGAQLLHVREEQVSNTSSTSPIVNSAFNVQVLNTVKTNEISGASLATNTITLPAGTYFIDAICRSLNHTTTSGVTIKQKARLRNTTDGVTVLVGATHGSTVGGGGLGGNDCPEMGLKGRFTLAGTKNLQLQLYFNSSSGNSSQYSGAASGEVEVYGEVLIWKVA